MSDNDNKNPWGNNKGGPRKNPWGQPGGQGNGSEQPDLDEMFKRFGSGFKGFMGSGDENGKPVKIIALGVLAALALWLASGFYIVEPGEHAVIQRFGAHNRTKVTEGLGYPLPSPIETATIINVQETRQMTIGFYERYSRSGAANKQDIPEESLMLTSDRNIVDLDLVIQWNIKSAEDYLFRIQDQENTIKKVAESAIREAVGQTKMFPIITTGRDEVAKTTRQIIQENLDEYHSGVNINQVLIQQAEVHPDVQNAFQDVQSAKQDAEDVQNRARAYREDILPKARGAAVQTVREAEAYKESTVARATGDADRFNSVYTAYLSGKDVTKERIYIETMESVLKNAQKIILDSEGGSSGVVPYLPLNELNRQPQATTTTGGNK